MQQDIEFTGGLTRIAGFCYYSDLIPQIHTNTHMTHRDQYTYTLVKHICYVRTAVSCITLNE